MQEAKKLQKKIDIETCADVEDEYLYKLADEYQTRTLLNQGWHISGITSDGRYCKIYKNKKNSSTECILGGNGTFSFTTNSNNKNYWFYNLIIFKTIIDNL